MRSTDRRPRRSDAAPHRAPGPGQPPGRIQSARGIALPVAIFALVIVGALVAASFFVGRQEQLVGRNTIRLQQAFAAAEAGADGQAATWDPQRFNRLAPGDSVSFEGALPGTGWYRGVVRRLGGLLFLIRSEGFSPDSTARQQVGLVVQLHPLELRLAAALTTVSAVDLDGSSGIDGNDHTPFGWPDCPSPGTPLAGVRLPAATLLTAGAGCTGLGCIAGAPAVTVDSALTAADLGHFGDVAFDALRALATKTVAGGPRRIAPSVGGGSCRVGDPDNWGSPLQPAGPCGGYFPLVWADGDLSINGAQGQGVLVVDGDLVIQGNFEFYGPVIVRGRVQTAGTGGRITGGLVTVAQQPQRHELHGNALVQYSRCALDRALIGSSRASLLRERSWANLY